MTFLLFVAAVVLAVAYVRLSNRVERIEEAFRAARSAAPIPTSVGAGAAPSPAPLPPSEGEFIAPLPSPGAHFVAWLKEDWLVKVGALLLFIGFSWFVSYAFMEEWVGPMGQIAIGLLFGSALMVFGWMRTVKYINQGSIFLALGTAIVVLTTFAARSEYDFFTPSSALAIMFFAVLFSAVASYRLRTKWLAWMSALAAYVIPLLTASHEVHELELFTYLFLVTIGVLWLIFLTDWRRIFFTSLAAVTAYSLPQWESGFVSEDGLLIYGFLFVALFFISNLAGFLSLPKGRSADVEIVGAIWNTVILSGWIYAGIGEEYQSLVYAAWATVFLISAYLFAVRVRMVMPFYLYGGIGVILIGIATALELEGPALTIAFLLESTVAILLARSLSKSKLFHALAYLTFLVPGALALESFARFPTHPSSPFNDHVAVVLLTTIALFVIGWWSLRREEENTDGRATWGGLFFSVAGLSGFVFLWQLLHALLPDVVATQTSLFISIVAGVALYLFYRNPTSKQAKVLHFVGLLLVLFVIGHLLFVEVWDMDTVPRIITFFVVGLFLMGTAFMKKLQK